MRELPSPTADSPRSGPGCDFTQLVETRGSTPQKPGRQCWSFPMEVSRELWVAACSVEAEVKRRHMAILPNGPAELMSFQLDSDYGWDDGLICCEGGCRCWLSRRRVERTSATTDRCHNCSILAAGAHRLWCSKRVSPEQLLIVYLFRPRRSLCSSTPCDPHCERSSHGPCRAGDRYRTGRDPTQLRGSRTCPIWLAASC